MKPRRTILIHGKGGSPDTSWLPWVGNQLLGVGYMVKAPKFPPQDDSKLTDWFMVLNALDAPYENTTFVAHARGAMALLRWVNSLPASTRIHQIITVACNRDHQPDRADGDEFYSKPLDYTDIINKCSNISVIHSDDDPYVPISAGQGLANNLQAKFVRYQTAGHFGSSKLEAPEILKEIF